jgi:hypothetical protein
LIHLQREQILEAFQTLKTGRIPANLLSFGKLHDSLKNETLNLPEGCELAMGSLCNQMPWYYMHADAAIVADFRSFKLTILLHITVANDHFELYQMLTFPTRVSNASFVSFYLENKYFAISVFRQTHLTYNELELSRCKGDRDKVCPADKTISSTKQSTCELSLFVQSLDAQKVCRRVVSAVTPPAMLQRHGTYVLYFLPEPRHAYLRCRNGQGWNTSSVVLEGGGSLIDAQGCHITLGDLQLQTTLRGENRIQDQASLMLYPLHSAVTSHSEGEALEKITADQRTLELLSKFSVHEMHASVDTLLALHAIMSPHMSGLEWTTAVYISAAVSLSLIILYHYFPPLMRKILHCFARHKSREAEGITTPAPESSATAQTPMESTSTTPPVHSLYALH